MFMISTIPDAMDNTNNNKNNRREGLSGKVGWIMMMSVYINIPRRGVLLPCEIWNMEYLWAGLEPPNQQRSG